MALEFKDISEKKNKSIATTKSKGKLYDKLFGGFVL